MHELGILPRAKRKGIIKPGKWALPAFFLLTPANLFGQMASPRTIDEHTLVSASASSSHQFKSNMDGGGDVSVSHYAIGVGGGTRLRVIRG